METTCNNSDGESGTDGELDEAPPKKKRKLNKDPIKLDETTDSLKNVPISK